MSRLCRLCDRRQRRAVLRQHLVRCLRSGRCADLRSDAGARYCDFFPLAEYAEVLGVGARFGIPGERRTRMDGAHSKSLGSENPLRYVRADTAFAETGFQNAATYLRFRVRPGQCQTDTDTHPFFLQYAPNAWHEARMDTGHAWGTGETVAGTYMTCYHPDDPLDGTSWGEELTPLESCDDIIGDNVLVSGTTVDYFMEVRVASGPGAGDVVGTSPAARNGSPIDTTATYTRLWRKVRILPGMVGPGCDPQNPEDRANEILLVYDAERPVQRERMRALMDTFGLGYDEYLTRGTNYSDYYNTIGRREDRGAQAPRPPLNGATAAQLDPYRCIWYDSYTLTGSIVLTDELTEPENGGQPARDQQAFEGWLDACTPGDNRFLILSGYGWASDADASTVNGPAFLANRGVTVISRDYDGLTGDLRRCARITGTGPQGSGFDGEFFGTGCPDDRDNDADVFAPVAGGVATAHYVLSGGGNLNDCLDDFDTPENVAMIQNAPTACERTWAVAAPLVRTHDLKCDTEACLFEEFTITGQLAGLFSRMWEWAGKPIGDPIAVPTPDGAPALSTQLIGARPQSRQPGGDDLLLAGREGCGQAAHLRRQRSPGAHAGRRRARAGERRVRAGLGRAQRCRSVGGLGRLLLPARGAGLHRVEEAGDAQVARRRARRLEGDCCKGDSP